MDHIVPRVQDFNIKKGTSFTVTHLSQLFFSLLIVIFLANLFPVSYGSLKALCGYGGFSEADKDGIVTPPSAV